VLGAISGRFEWVLAVLACVACAVFAIVGSAQSAPGASPSPALVTPAATSATPATAAPKAVPLPSPKATAKAVATAVPVDLTKMAAGVTLRQTVVRAAASRKAPALSMLRAGIILPFSGVHQGWVRVFTPCEIVGWARSTDFTLIRAASATGKWSDAVFVIDPGHGGREPGAIGPYKHTEKDINLGIAIRLAQSLKGARVYLTRNGNYTTGLRYRAILASRLHATALVSMHNNSGPVVRSAIPGTQAWHQSRSVQSAKLATLLYKNVFAAMSKYKATWVASKKIGTLVRLDKKGQDYYAILRQSSVPAVIVESLFISNKSEERLLAQPHVRQAIADAAAKSLREYVAAGGAKYVKPLPVKIGKTGGLRKGCVDPL
jgi:N-acetylmuramoyl-L-alanine amidase